MIFRDRIDPQLRAWYDASAGFDFDHLETFVPACNAAERANLKEDPAVRVYNRTVPGPESGVEIRVYAPTGQDTPLPCVFFYHGGGFLFGSVYRQEDLCQRYVKNVGCVVVSVEYRLAPKWKSPAPLEDCYGVLTWVYAHPEELNIQQNKLAVCGLSAGGNLAAAVSLLARDRGGPNLSLQLPLYAELDCRMDTASFREITDTKLWCQKTCRQSWEQFLDPKKPVTGYDCPSLCADLSGLPPAFSYIGQLDPGREENITYWTRLMQAGVPVEYHVFPGCYHCFELSVPDAAVSRTAYALTYKALRRAFAV